MKKILFLGDFFYDYNIINKDIENISKYIKENNYCCVLNLEGPLSSEGEKRKKRGPNLYQNIITIEVLKKLNVIGVTISNNHIMDFGEEGLIKTIKLLKENNIKYCGAGKTLEEASAPMNLKIEEKEVYIYNHGWNLEETLYAKKNKAGCSPRKSKHILKQLQNIKKKNINLPVIVTLHWGFEYNLYPLPLDIKLAHKIIDKGADLIIGHHPHVIQSFERYCKKEIYYSLGNFYFGTERYGFNSFNFKGKNKNLCNYGLGVVYDVETNKVCDRVFFKYDCKHKQTYILKKIKNEKEILTNITNINYNKNEFCKKIKEGKLKKNPILSGNRILDMLKIILIYTRYWLIKYLPVTIKIKQMLKKCINK